MVITLNILRMKKDNEIHELFTVTPEINYCFDNKRSIFYKLWKIRNENSIHKLGYKIKDIQYFDKIIYYIFEYNNMLQIPNITEIHKINYNPVVGKKLCSKCIYLKKNTYCSMKGIKVNKHSYYKCLYWMEKECI